MRFGTHGKTTTTGMLSSVLIETDLAPTISWAVKWIPWGGNLLHGSYELLLTESCEYKKLSEIQPHYGGSTEY